MVVGTRVKAVIPLTSPCSAIPPRRGLSAWPAFRREISGRLQGPSPSEGVRTQRRALGVEY